jgi:hypothetical protein
VQTVLAAAAAVVHGGQGVRADPKTCRFLTGDVAAVRRVCARYSVSRRFPTKG